MTVKDEWERILISDVSVQHIHLVVHHCIDGFEYEMEREEMPGSIYHKPSIRELGTVFNGDWQVAEQTFKLTSCRIALNCLGECLQSPDKSNIRASCDD